MHSVLALALLQATSAACPPGNLALGRNVDGQLLRGYPRVVTDGALQQEGMWWESPGSVVLTSAQATLTIDLADAYDLRALVLQGDNNDVYHVEASTDGQTWREIWAAGPNSIGFGLRTRWISLPATQNARYLRVHGTDGDGFFSVSEVQAYCQVPAVWPPKLILPPPLAWWNPVVLWNWLDNPRMVGVKGSIAFLGALLLAWGIWLKRQNREHEHKKLRDGVLAFLGVFALFSWWNLGHFHFNNYLHTWEHYHYYVGAKYFRELGYTRLYYCTAVADEEAGVSHKDMRNLVTNELERVTVLDHDYCKRHFTEERWQKFTHDVAFFRWALGSRWETSKPAVLEDHGYNGTPVWGILGSLLANAHPASMGYITFLGALDSILLLVMWGVVVWAFGWRAACVAALYWGTNYPARYWWNGGAFLRMDWLVASIIGICLVKKGKNASGGFALTYGALLRIFPGFIVIGLLLKAIAKIVRARKWVLSREHFSFAKGCVAALALLIPLSAAIAGGGQRLGMDAWFGAKGDDNSVVEQGFVQNSAKHLHTPLTNNMGLKTIVAYEHDMRASRTRNYGLADPFEVWKNARNGAFERRKILWALMVVGFMVLLGWSAERQEDWVALTMGVGMIPVATELTCYYYSFGLAFGFLWLKRENLGVASCLLAALSCLIPGLWPWDDEAYTWISLVYILFVVGSTYYLGRIGKLPEAADEPAPILEPAVATASASGRGGGKRKRR